MDLYFRRVTGHSAVDIVRKHYFRPNQETFRKEFARVADGFYQTDSKEDEAPIAKLKDLLEGMNGKNWQKVKAACMKVIEKSG